MPQVGSHIGFDGKAVDVVAAFQLGTDPAAPRGEVTGGGIARTGIRRVQGDPLIDQLRLGFYYPVFADANRKTAFYRKRHRAAFGDLSGALFIATVAIDPTTAGGQIDVPTLWASQAPVGAEALPLQVESVVARVRLCAVGHQAVAVAMELGGAANQADPLGMTAIALQGHQRRAFVFAGARDGKTLGQGVGLCLARGVAIELIPGPWRGVLDGQAGTSGIGNRAEMARIVAGGCGQGEGGNILAVPGCRFFVGGGGLHFHG
ncbi:hypothetical protein D3C76_745890 [compost metagenome]